MRKIVNFLARRARPLALLALLAALSAPFGPARPPAAHAQTLDGLVGYWPFDEGAGATSADVTGSGNTATLYNAGFTPDSAPIGAANPYALALSGAQGSYASAPGAGIDDLQQFTISFWVRFNQPAPTGVIMPLVALGPKADLSLFISPGGSAANELFFHALIEGIKRTLVVTGISTPALAGIADGAYHHIVGSFDGRIIRLGVDTSQYLSGFNLTGSPANLASSRGAGVQFGSPSAPFSGALDDVQIYSRALGAGEVFQLYGGCARVSDIPAAECQALVDLYDSAGGDGWANRDGWVQRTQACSWHGVLCANGHVFGLYLGANGLSGAISPTLGGLSQLSVLDLSANQLSGPIPNELGGLTNLQTLFLQHNRLEQTIPVTFGGLAQLQALRLDNNRLRGAIPAQLAGLNQRLTTLNISDNMLAAADPAVLSMLGRLQPAWAATQTVPPANLRAGVRSATSVDLSWTPIAYSGDGGYYDVLAAPQPGGTFSSVGHTADKSAAGFTVSGLSPGQSYQFTIRSFTPAHGEQQSDLLSDAGDLASATPSDTTIDPATITIALDAQPDSRANIHFTGDLGRFTLDDISPQDGDAFSNSKTFSVPAGTYTVTEQLSPLWSNPTLFCDPPQGTIVDLAQHQIVIRAAAGAAISCTFVTQRNGEIVAGAYDDRNANGRYDRPDAWLAGWQMQVTSARTLAVMTAATDAEGRARFTHLPPGDYQVCAIVPAGWQNVTPGGAAPCYQVTVAPRKAVWARFGNTQATAAAAEAVPVAFKTAAVTAEASPRAQAAADDIIICDLPATDDAGNPVGPETDPWELQDAPTTVFLPLVVR